MRAALDVREAQTCRDQLEILILCPDAEHTGPLPPGQVAIPTGSLLFHQARALAIRRATADYVMLAEDHCPPDPSWAQAILRRIAEGWDAVGPALRSGNPATLWSQSTFLLGYGQWMRPVRAMRTRRWPWIARALYWLGTPLTAARHWARAVTHYIRAGRQAGLNPLCLAVAALSASVWASGEAIGALKGPARVAPSVWISEIRPLAPMDA